jgi:hypothetical protein
VVDSRTWHARRRVRLLVCQLQQSVDARRRRHRRLHLLAASGHALRTSQAAPLTSWLSLWTTLLILVALWLSPPTLWVIAIPLMLTELAMGNVHILMAAAVVLGLTRSASWWSFPLLLKVTPGLGFAWFAVRREWRNLAIALSATGAIVAVSLAIVPAFWPEWIAFLVRNIGSQPPDGSWLAVPLVVRLPISLVLIGVAARTDRPWIVPLAVLLALPIVWMTSATVPFVLAAIRLYQPRRASIPQSLKHGATIELRAGDATRTSVDVSDRFALPTR